MNHWQFTTGGESSLHPAILVVLLVAIVLTFALPRRYVLLPLLLLSFTIPVGQRLMIGQFHFPVLRIMLVPAWARLLWQRYGKEGQKSKIRLNQVDKAVILYMIVCVICFTIQWQKIAAFYDQLGWMYNVLGFYFVFRFFLREQTDVEILLKGMTILSLIIAACMLNEQVTGRNVLAMFGGVPEHTAVRGAYLRSQGPFRVYLTAGAFGATLVPLFLCLWRKGGSRFVATAGVLAALTITITSRTSTAISACLATAIGIGMWRVRGRLREVRWALVGALVGLHLIMKAPVWALIARIDLVGGSTGWHRYKIIDNFVHHFWDWWLVGANDYWSWDGGDSMWDAANQYVAVGQETGLLSLILFLATIVYSFKYLGDARRATPDSRQQWFLWLLGVALFSNVVAMLGISYFDQTFIYWYALLAMIIAVAAPGRSLRAVSTGAKAAPSNLGGWEAQHCEPQSDARVSSAMPL